MTDLLTLAMQRAALPTFAGTTLAEQLLSGEAEARATLLCYDPTLTFDPAAAAAANAQVKAWIAANNEALKAALSNPNVEALPEAIRLGLGPEALKAFIVGGYVTAARGLGPWASGRVAVEAASNAVVDGTVVDVAWAKDDAEARLVTFGSIVQFHQSGLLAKLYGHECSSVSGLGEPVSVTIAIVLAVAAVLAVVGVVGVVLYYTYYADVAERNNKILGEMCAKSQAEGDQKTVLACVDATTSGKPVDWSKILWPVAVMAGVVGLGYVGVKYAMPQLLAGRPATANRRRRAA